VTGVQTCALPISHFGRAASQRVPAGVGESLLRKQQAAQGGTAAEIETGTVVALNHEGAGIVREGKTAFVPGALPGETITFIRTKRHRQHDDAKLIDVLVAARDRVTPKCPHFGVCGGCALQHMAPHAQLAAKERELRDNLERIAHTSPEIWLEPLRGPEWAYRRRARLGAKYVPKKGRVVVGFRERLAPYIAALESCAVLAEPV